MRLITNVPPAMTAIIERLGHRKHFVPVALEVCAMVVKLMLQFCFIQHALARSHVLAYGYADAYRTKHNPQ